MGQWINGEMENTLSFYYFLLFQTPFILIILFSIYPFSPCLYDSFLSQLHNLRRAVA